MSNVWSAPTLKVSEFNVPEPAGVIVSVLLLTRQLAGCRPSA